jgi:hypothetical protein
MEWKLLDEETACEMWNETLIKFSDLNVFQSLEWGEFRQKVSGVKPCRWIAFDDGGEAVALFQGLLIRRFLDFGIIVGEGGPVGDFEVCLPALQRTILSTLGLRKCYCRIYPKRQYQVKDALLLRTYNWKRTMCTISSGWSMCLDLTKDKEEILSGFSRNWCRNLRRANKKGLNIEVWRNPDAPQILSVYNAMESFKQLRRQFTQTEIQTLLKVFRDGLILFHCVDQSGETLGLRGCISIGSHGLDFLAATSEKGRKTYASYALFWQMIQTCLEKGIRSYDLNGIDPLGNLGVYNFKKGTGAATVEYLGEWDWATSETLRVIMNIARSKQANVEQRVRKVKRLFCLSPQKGI